MARLDMESMTTKFHFHVDSIEIHHSQVLVVLNPKVEKRHSKQQAYA
jgi:hypothetical protein